MHTLLSSGKHLLITYNTQFCIVYVLCIILHYLGKCCEISDHTMKLQDHVYKLTLGQVAEQVTR